MERLHPPHDHLFEAGCDHSTSGAICAYYNSDRVIPQSDCSNDSPIHYGLIAFGNKVIRDGVARARLRKELNVLCFEMEAAGLADNSPCVVIRGHLRLPRLAQKQTMAATHGSGSSSVQERVAVRDFGKSDWSHADGGRDDRKGEQVISSQGCGRDYGNLLMQILESKTFEGDSF
jgi:hypothetical protein